MSPVKFPIASKASIIERRVSSIIVCCNLLLSVVTIFLLDIICKSRRGQLCGFDFAVKTAILVGMTGFEPATSWSQTRRATNCATSRYYLKCLWEHSLGHRHIIPQLCRLVNTFLSTNKDKIHLVPGESCFLWRDVV